MGERLMVKLEDVNTLEQLVDRYGMETLLRSLSEICEAKAAHVFMVWNDKQLSKLWERTGKRIEKCADYIKERVGI